MYKWTLGVVFTLYSSGKKKDVLLRYLHISSHKLYLLLLLEILTCAVSNYSCLKSCLISKIRSDKSQNF